MEKMMSGANNGANPLKSILKITRPKDAAGDTIGAAGAGKTKKDGVGIQPFKVAMPIKDVNEANKSTGSDHGSEAIHTERIHEVSPSDSIVKSVDILEKPTSYAGAVGASDKMVSGSCVNPRNPEQAKINFRSFLNEEKVESSDCVLPRGVADVVKIRYENTLVGYFLGKNLAFKLVQNYVNNTWSKFGFQKLMKTDDGVYLFKFSTKSGMEQVLERGSWIIRNSPLILCKWTPNVCLKKGEVYSLLIWVKLYNVPVLAYSGDGLSLIATQIGKPLMLDAFTSSMCVESWGRISFARALIEISVDSALKMEVVMAIPIDEGDDYTRETIKAAINGPKVATRNADTVDHADDGFTEVSRKKNKGTKADQRSKSRHIDGIRLNKPKPNFFWQKKGSNKSGDDLNSKGQMSVKSPTNQANGPSTSNSFELLINVDLGDECGVSSSMGTASTKSPTRNEESESDDEVDEVIFPEGDEFGDKLDIRLKGRVDLLQFDTGLVVPYFLPTDDPLESLYKALAFRPTDSELCGNCSKGNDHIARQCTQPTRVQNSAWFMKKMLLAQVQEAGIDLNGIDLYDSDCDEDHTAQASFMANLSSYGSNVLSEANQEKNNESLTAELERYKERVKTFKHRLNIDLSTREKMIDSQMDDMIRDRLALKQQIDSLEQNLSNQIKEKKSLLQTLTVLKNESKGKESKYMDKEIDLEKKIKELDNIVYKVIHVTDEEETLILEEVSRSKMLAKQNDPISLKQKINFSPINYSELNKLSEDFGKRFVPQMQLSAEQAFWLPFSNPKSEHPNDTQTSVRVEVPKELPKVSLVNTSVKRLKNHLVSFEKVAKVRTTHEVITEGSWGFEHTKKVFNEEVIPFKISLQTLVKDFENGLLNELNEVKTVFNQMEAAVDQCSIDNKLFEIEKKELKLENERLLEHIICQDVVNIVMHANDKSVNVLPVQNTFLDDNIALDVMKMENDRLVELLVSQDLVHTAVNSLAAINDYKSMEKSYLEKYNENLELKAQLLKRNNKIEQDVFIELSKRYSQLEKHCISLQLAMQQSNKSFQNDKPCENQDAPEFREFFIINELKALLQAKYTTISNLKKHIQELKGKSVADFRESVNKPKVIAPAVLKLDLEPLSSKLKNNRKSHVDYIKITKEISNTFCDIVEQARTSNSLDNTSLLKTEKLVAVTPMNKARNVIWSMTSEQLGLGLGLHQLTYGYISSGLVQNSISSTPYVPPSKKDYEILFQLLIDVYFNHLPRAVSPDPVAFAAPRVVDPAGSPSSNYH
ncbi:reverse transcriptase domain, reverse transcriptase zinc-binding domain protein [Tanacetum coccineum]